MVENLISMPLPEDIGDAQYLSLSEQGCPILLRVRQNWLLRLGSYIDYSKVLPVSWPVVSVQGAIDHRATLQPFVDALAEHPSG